MSVILTFSAVLESVFMLDSQKIAGIAGDSDD